MTDLTHSPIRDLIAQLARIEDIRRVTPTHTTRNTPGAPTSTVAALELAEQDIIEELRRPDRPRPGLYGPQGTASHPQHVVAPPHLAPGARVKPGF